jgi:hypothetical protein
MRKGQHCSEATKKKMSDAAGKGEKNHMFGKHLPPETRLKISNANKGKPLSKEHCKRISEAAKRRGNGLRGKHHTLESRRKRSAASKGEKNHNFGKKCPESVKTKMSKLWKGKPRTETDRAKIIEAHVGGFWYGSVKSDTKKRYCELWNPNLWERIDAYQNYKSILSGKTKVDNKDRALSRHHVYWQEKACCEWDEDAEGYYAMIDIGTRKKPEMYKHYVGRDPNKFVLLTRSEHGMVGKNKLKWIKIFEDLIEKQGGKCYYTKEEWNKKQNELRKDNKNYY